jgi:glycine/D-amino acid oxidase-like deaminating enzyme
VDGLETESRASRPSLEGSHDADVVVVGAGFTGLWTAFHLVRADPRLRVVILEAAVVGAGASSRNGGWCSSILPMSWDRVARESSRDGAIRMQRAMFDTVDRVLVDIEQSGIDARAHRGGWLNAATGPAHTGRLHAELHTARRYGFGEDDYRWLDRTEAAARIDAAGTLGAVYSPHCAVLDPARLVQGLAEFVEALGVRIHESSRVERIEPNRVVTRRGSVRADFVIRATEAYTTELPGRHRDLVPVYSMMIATEPLAQEVWSSIGWNGREAFSDARHLIVYAQRTADDRLAFGGRGAPYHFGSRIDPRFDADASVHRQLLPDALHRLFPILAGVRLTHAWGGPLGAPRDWFCSVGLDRRTGLAWAGGYVGDGVATSHLAGRTLADLVLGTDSDLTSLPWVDHRSRRWEPEPFRWLGINAGRRLAAGADRTETVTGRPSRWRERALDALMGR